MAYSFYGGKEGRSIVIKAHFDTIADMCEAFSRGGDFSDVGFHEYVIIDTIINTNKKSDPQNGIIYRRGLDYQADGEAYSAADGEKAPPDRASADYITEGEFDEKKYLEAFAKYVKDPGAGAEYIGQIVGPQGEATELEVIPWHNAEGEQQDFASLYKSQSGLFGKKDQITLSSNQMTPGRNTAPAEVGTTYEGKTVVSDNDEEFDSETQIRQSDTIHTVYNDSIQYGYINIKDTDGNVTGCYIAFDVPYPIFEFSATQIENAYAKPSIEEDVASKVHPYYWKYTLSIPQGVHGTDSILKHDSTTSEYYIEERKYTEEGIKVEEVENSRVPAKFINNIIKDGNNITFEYTTKVNGQNESQTFTIPTFSIAGYINDPEHLTQNEADLINNNANQHQIYGFYADQEGNYYLWDPTNSVLVAVTQEKKKISYISSNSNRPSASGGQQGSIWFELVD